MLLYVIAEHTGTGDFTIFSYINLNHYNDPNVLLSSWYIFIFILFIF